MFALRRWWDRYGLKLGLTVLAVVVAWAIRQMSGAPVLEVYQSLASPFDGVPSREQILNAAQDEAVQQRIAELESQNQMLKELISYDAGQPAKGVMAPVIGRSADQWWQQIIVRRGSNDNIQVNDLVASTGGLVGRVSHVTANTSRVLLISDPASQIGAMVNRSRTMGYLRGQSESRAVLVFFDRFPDVKPGDIVSTSPLSQILPAGFPIGRVESIDNNVSPSPEAIIELSAPVSSLEWVVVYSNSKGKEAEMIEDGAS
ncbi:MAG: rod shape-determining protein MreC [Elainellaceae cyanobacterium]